MRYSQNFTESSLDKSCRTQRCIQSNLHNAYSIQQNKIILNPNDHKRYLIPGSYLPWGHFSQKSLNKWLTLFFVENNFEIFTYKNNL